MAKHGPEAVADPDNFEAPGQTKGRLLPATTPPCSWQSRRVAVVASGDLVTASARPCSAWRRPPLAGCFWPLSLSAMRAGVLFWPAASGLIYLLLLDVYEGVGSGFICLHSKEFVGELLGVREDFTEGCCYFI
jgi:hypothetical protein